jgi:plastocyanin
MALDFPASPALNDTFTAGNTTWQYDGTSWNIVTASSSVVIPTIPNGFSTVAVAGQNNIVAESTTDTLNVVAGDNITITTDAGTDSLTITATAGGSGEVNQNAFSNIAVSGQTTVAADTTTDTVTFVGNSGITITTDASTDTVTFTGGGGGGSSTFNLLTDVNTASLSVDKIYLPAITMLDVTNNGSSAYRFDQYGASNNPTIYAINGTTIAFNLSTMGSTHPFLIQDFSATNYNTGLVHVANDGTVSTGADAQGKSTGVLYWKIPSSESGTFRYQCSLHGGMVGNITVKNFVSL